MAVVRGDGSAAGEQYAALKFERGTKFFGTIADGRLLGLLAHTTGDLDQASAHFEDTPYPSATRQATTGVSLDLLRLC